MGGMRGQWGSEEKTFKGSTRVEGEGGRDSLDFGGDGGEEEGGERAGKARQDKPNLGRHSTEYPLDT